MSEETAAGIAESKSTAVRGVVGPSARSGHIQDGGRDSRSTITRRIRGADFAAQLTDANIVKGQAPVYASGMAEANEKVYEAQRIPLEKPWPSDGATVHNLTSDTGASNLRRWKKRHYRSAPAR